MVTAIGGWFVNLGAQVLKTFFAPQLQQLDEIQTAWQTFMKFLDGASKTISTIFGGLAKDAKGFLSYLDPTAKHSPSLVENVTAGVAAIKQQYLSLSNLQMPNLASQVAAQNTAYNTNTYRNNTVSVNNVFNVKGQANAQNTASYLAFQYEHLGIV
jgi:hypothetical protein